MKKQFKIYILLLGFFALSAFKGNAQDNTNMLSIVQKCIEIGDLQDYLTSDVTEGSESLTIMNFPSTIPAENDLELYGKPVTLLSREEVSAQQISNYLNFRRVAITGNTASVSMNLFYQYNYADNSFKMLSVMVQLDKSDGVWENSSITIGGDTL